MITVKTVRSSISSFHVTWYLGGCCVRLAKKCNFLHTSLCAYACVSIINTVHFDITKHCSCTELEVQTGILPQNVTACWMRNTALEQP